MITLHKLAATMALTLAAAMPAQAQCKFANELVRQYGISATGMAIALKPVEAPTTAAWSDPAVLAIRLHDQGDIRDGFQHDALLNHSLKQLYLHRSGGFAGVSEWFGPIPLKRWPKERDLANCQTIANPLASKP